MSQYKNIAFQGNLWTRSTTSSYETRNSFRWLNKESKILTIGSCFATNFGRWISKHGISTTTPPWGLHYNSKTILNELENCLGIPTQQITWQVTDNENVTHFFDAKRHPIFANTADELATIRAGLTEAGSKAISDATAFLITVGLTEIWEQYEADNWHCINRSPMKGISDQAPPVFRNRFQTVAEIKKDIKHIVNTLNPNAKRDLPIVFTTSPIPLKTSGMNYDPRIANVRSKSNLIAAIHEFLDENPSLSNVSYFPAFEMFYQAPDYDESWQRDGRHVTAKKTDEVCRMFINIYALDPAVFEKAIDFQVPEV